jgi:dephospho-CoA kinase
MINVGITGGIGSGKSTFCKIWEELGAKVIYADDLAKELMVANKALIKSIKETFGDEAYNLDGTLNRAFLAEEAFSKGRVEELNALVHPVLWDELSLLEHEAKQKGTQIFAREAAILLKNGRPDNLDVVILVLADRDKRINRATKRDGVDPDAITQRIDQQEDFESLIHLSDFLVLNNGSEEELKLKAKEIYELLVS